MDRVRHAVTELGLSEVVDIRKNQVGSESEASEIAFLGFSSIRVDGQDVELGVSPDGTFGLRCRLYHVDGRPDEAPPINWIKRALLAADI